LVEQNLRIGLAAEGRCGKAAVDARRLRKEKASTAGIEAGGKKQFEGGGTELMRA